MKKKKYTYATDEKNLHLGGNFIEGDPATFSPSAWQYLINKFNLKSVLDVGSGRGYAGQWFLEKGLSVVAIDGLHDNVANSIIPSIEHDLTKAPFLHVTDFVNCVEVVEHIEEAFLDNLLDTLCSGKILLMTHAIPGQDGWHHVNCQNSEYWINHLKVRNFILLEDDSKKVQQLAHADGAAHIARNGLVFKNASR
jgi:SAM-dependent methyltransferase